MLVRKAYSADEFREIIGMSRNGIYAGIRRGEIPSVRIGRRVLIPASAVEEMFGSQAPPADQGEHGAPLMTAGAN